MVIFEERDGDVLTLRIEGRLDGETCGEVDRRFGEIADSSDRCGVVLDCSALAYVSSAGLRSILVLGKKQRAASRGFALAAPSATVQEILALSGFSSLFAIHPDVGAAVAALRA
ncbi:MAG: hypothetical protein RLZZ565_1142 [Planctomycetota bacterium]|jgi:anti-anti-sigma factor